jgi:CubicO group peptidase (beta-lactamase class C family)
VPARHPFTVREVLTFTWGMGMQGAMFTSERPWPVCVAAQDRTLGTFSEPDPAGIPDPDTWLAGLAQLPLLAQPGERWLYQSGSQLLGVLAARVAGRPFEQLMRERLFEPVGMPDTAFHTTETDRLATAYQRVDGELRVSDPPDGAWSVPPRFPDGGAGLVSTVDDVLAFGVMLLRGGDAVLPAGVVAQMTSNQLSTAQRAVWPGFDMLSGRGWGYGVSVFEDGAYGWDGGLGTTWCNGTRPARPPCARRY